VPNLKRKHLLRKNTAYILNFAILVSIIFVWIHNIQSITIIFSVIGAGMVLALSEAILCMAGWVFLIVRRPYEVGDRIELGGVKGDVIDIRMFNTTMLEIGNWVEDDQSTGRIVNVPNSHIFKQAYFNYSRGFEFIWNEIRILVTFESDWERGKEIMMEHGEKEAEGMEDIVKRKINKMTLQYMIFFDRLTPVVYVNIKDSGVELTLRYLTETHRRRSSQDKLCQAILDDFEKEPKVNFAYPTYRIVKQG
jgi:small-conductance mechanosensitive channel